MKKINKVARQRLDQKYRSYKSLERPPRGWVRAIREALGMTAKQLAKRLSISPQSLLALEKREQNKTVTLKQLERAAEQLGCRLEYTLVPSESLETMIDRRVLYKARKKLERVSKSMELEDQALSDVNLKQQLEFLKEDLISGPDKHLWEEEYV